MSIAPALDILALMKYPEDKDVGFADAVDESEGIHEKLANVRIAALRYRGAAFTEDPQGVSCTENALEQT